MPNTPPPDDERCRAIAKKSERRCKFRRKPDSNYCGVHADYDGDPYEPKQFRRGAPTKCSPELIRAFANVLKAGNYIETACEYLGISLSTFYHWKDRAAEAKKKIEAGERISPDEELWIEFSETTARARAQAEVTSVARIRKAAGEGNVEADKWFLERSFPDRWGRQRHDHKVDIGSGVELVFEIPEPRVLGSDTDPNEVPTDDEL